MHGTKKYELKKNKKMDKMDLILIKLMKKL